MKIKYLHTMIRIKNIENSIKFYCDFLGLKEIRRKDSKEGRYTLIFLAAPFQEQVSIELTYNWDTSEDYTEGRNFGHIAFEVEDIYQLCERLQNFGVKINRPLEMVEWLLYVHLIIFQ